MNDVETRFNSKFKKKQSSYMMVIVLGMLELLDDSGRVGIDDLANFFRGFYLLRTESGKLPEKKEREISDINNMTIGQVKSLMKKMPIRYLEDLIYYDEEKAILFFSDEIKKVLNDANKRALRKLVFRHLYEYYSNLDTLQLTLKDLGNMPLDYAIRANDVESLSGQNQVKGIHPIEKNGYKAVVVLCTISGGSYPNEWLDSDSGLLRYYAEGRKSSDGKRIFNLDIKSNKSIKDSKVNNVPLYIFIRYKKGDLFHYEGEFEYVRYKKDSNGSVYFELKRKNEGEGTVPIPDVSRDDIISAMKKFDKEFRDTEELRRWEDKSTQRYAINYEDRLYPPKWIIEIATGMSRKKFHGGSQSNSFLKARGFEIIELRKRDNNNDINIRDGERHYDVSEVIEHVISYIGNKGFVYSPEFVKNFFLCLKTKPFVILAGISGTGKSKIGEFFSEAIGANAENGRFRLIPVRPDWIDSSDLMGYKNLQGEFVEGQLISVIRDALENPEAPYFVCLDEMNLARVEYYFSDFLSVIESRRVVNGRILSAPVMIDGMDDVVRFPDNLFLLGTVNMDETTHSFSRKVLDRANTIEFSDIKLNNFGGNGNNISAPMVQDSSFLRNDFVVLRDCLNAGYENYVRDKVRTLEEINSILGSNGFNVGYRVRDEFCFYMIYNKMFNLLKEDVATDFQIMQKVLPRIQGSSLDIELMLKKMVDFCEGKYPMSKDKAEFMLRRFEVDGFSSFWA